MAKCVYSVFNFNVVFLNVRNFLERNLHEVSFRMACVLAFDSLFNRDLIMALTHHLYYHWSNEVIQLLLPIIILLTIACGIVVIIELTLFYDTIKDYLFLTVLFHVPMLFWLIYTILVFIRRESSTIKTEIARMRERAKPAQPI